MVKNAKVLLAVAAALVVVAVAYFTGRSTGGGGGAPAKPKIVVVLPSSTNQFWIDVRRGAEEARPEVADYEVEVKVSTGDQDAKAQAFMLADLATRSDVAAVVLGPASATEPVQALATLYRKGVPTVVIDTMLDNAKLKEFGFAPTAFVGSNNREGAEKAAQAIHEELKRRNIPQPHRVLVIEGSRVHQSGIDRADGFYEAASKLGMQVEGVRGEWNRARAQDLTTQKFISGKFHAIFVGNDDMAIGAVTALKSLKVDQSKWPVIVGFDYIPDAVKAIEVGEMFGSVRQNPAGMGKKGVLLARLAAKKDPAIPTRPEFIPVEVHPRPR